MARDRTIQRDILWWVSYDQDKLALGKYNEAEQRIDTPSAAYDIDFYYSAYPTTLLGADITTIEPEIPERYQLALVDWVLRQTRKHSKETMANANYYQGFWEEAVKQARAEVNANKGAKQNAVTPFIPL